MKSSVNYLCAWLLLFPIITIGQTPAISVVKNEFIFDTAPFKACHASTVVKLGGGKLMAAWFGGTQESNPDVCIWLSVNQGDKWSAPLKVADGVQPDGKELACWNPVLFKSTGGRLYLHYKIGPNPREWWAKYKWSADEGKTWSEAIDLPKGFLGPIKNKPVQLVNGDILYPSSTESIDEKSWQIHLERSDAMLKSWQMINIDCDTFQVIQPSILVYPKHKMQLLARSKQNVIVQSWSYDDGATWEKLSKTTLPNPNSGSDAVNFKGTQLLVYNPLTAGKNWWEGRSVLKLAASSNGIEWHDVLTFENEKQGEFSYPAIIADGAGNVYITYTHNRTRIKFIQLKLKG